MSIADDRRPPPPWELLGALQDRLPRAGPVRARAARSARARRLEALGYEVQTLEQRRRTLALNVALREWPRR